MLQRLLVIIKVLSTFLFNYTDVSFFQYVMGLISVTGLLSQVEHLNTKMDMKKFIARWTGANLDRSEAIDICVNKFSNEHNRVLLQVRFLPVHKFRGIMSDRELSYK